MAGIQCNLCGASHSQFLRESEAIEECYKNYRAKNPVRILRDSNPARHTMAKDQKDCKVQYLGDGVYIAHDGFGFWLTAEDGMRATDAIYIEPPVLKSLTDFLEWLGGGK